QIVCLTVGVLQNAAPQNHQISRITNLDHSFLIQKQMHLQSQKIFPVFDLGDVVLREKQEADVEDFFRYYTDPEVNKFILCQIPQTLEDSRRELHYWRSVFYQNDGIYFAIADKQSGRMIGSIGLTSLNTYQSRVEISYDLAQEYWRRGITSRAIKSVVDYAFDVLRVNRIEASVSCENLPSKNLLIKCGFTLEGILRQHRLHKCHFVDVYFFSLLKSDLLTPYP
ncbi:MAG: GNAT family N-acetyltransferase, partial [Alphaproteobacteria bacterium]|nr:GNAT family N-acetyltransferase [Alphaproteobacteria bacterium]